MNAELIIRGIIKDDLEGISLDLFFIGKNVELMEESIALKKDTINVIEKMLVISSYVAYSSSIINRKIELEKIKTDQITKKQIKKFEEEIEQIEEEFKKIKDLLITAIKSYDELISYKFDSTLRQKLEDLLSKVQDNK